MPRQPPWKRTLSAFGLPGQRPGGPRAISYQSPHAAFYSAEREKELRRNAAQKLVDWARTGQPTYVVVEGK